MIRLKLYTQSRQDLGMGEAGFLKQFYVFTFFRCSQLTFSK